jgi:hypothetical protein
MLPNSPNLCFSSASTRHLFQNPMTYFKNLQADCEHLGGRCHELFFVSQVTCTGTDRLWVLMYFYFTNEWVSVTFLYKTDALKYTIQLLEGLQLQGIEKAPLAHKMQIFQVRSVFSLNHSHLYKVSFFIFLK